ncbi:MAG: hypothetical protein AAFU80_13365 [Pseudomonadota bacterium]
MIFFVTPGTVANQRKLHLTRLAAPMLGRGLRVVPRAPWGKRAFWRILFDQAPLRYAIALSPFPLAIAIRPDLALAISQAPLLMFGIVFMVESTVLSVQTPAKRRRLISEDDAARTLDRLQARGAEALSGLAASRGLASGRLVLVVEQSGLHRIPPLTLISVQRPVDGAPPELMDLTDQEQVDLATRLFDTPGADESGELDERRLLRVNQRDNLFIRQIAFEAEAVSAHARLRALAAQRAT